MTPGGSIVVFAISSQPMAEFDTATLNDCSHGSQRKHSTGVVGPMTCFPVVGFRHFCDFRNC